LDPETVPQILRRADMADITTDAADIIADMALMWLMSLLTCLTHV